MMDSPSNPHTTYESIVFKDGEPEHSHKEAMERNEQIIKSRMRRPLNPIQFWSLKASPSLR